MFFFLSFSIVQCKLMDLNQRKYLNVLLLLKRILLNHMFESILDVSTHIFLDQAEIKILQFPASFYLNLEELKKQQQKLPDCSFKKDIKPFR